MRKSIVTGALAGLVVVAVAGCGGSASSPSGTGGSTGGGTGGAPSGTGGGSGACPTTSLAVAITCSAFDNTAQMVTGTVESGTAPTPMGGGIITDGKYHATKLQLYGASATDFGSRRTTIIVTSGGTEMYWAVEASANGLASMGRINTMVSTSGTNLNSTNTCTSGAVNLPATLGYTATRDTLALQLTSGTMTTVTTYTWQGCQ